MHTQVSGLIGKALLCAALLCSAKLSAQSAPPAEPVARPVNSTEPEIDTVTEPATDMEEVIVYGERNLNLIRREYVAAEDLVFDMFNELNEQDEYDMVCYKEARIGSQIRFRVCKPGFMRAAESAAAEDYLMDIQSDGMAQANVFWADWQRKSLHQREIMARLANENPQFLELLKKRLELRHEYEASQASRWPRKHRKDKKPTEK